MGLHLGGGWGGVGRRVRALGGDQDESAGVFGKVVRVGKISGGELWTGGLGRSRSRAGVGDGAEGARVGDVGARAEAGNPIHMRARLRWRHPAVQAMEADGAGCGGAKTQGVRVGLESKARAAYLTFTGTTSPHAKSYNDRQKIAW